MWNRGCDKYGVSLAECAAAIYKGIIEGYIWQFFAHGNPVGKWVKLWVFIGKGKYFAIGG